MLQSLLLPPELWATTIMLLPRADQRTCLFVSRMHRAVALRLLFNIVHVHLGLHGASKLMENELTEREDATAQRSFDLLEAIIFVPEFAEGVKNMAVYSFSSGPSIFERGLQFALKIIYATNGLLLRALRALPHLRSFSWTGFCPRIDDATINALQTYCPHIKSLAIDEIRYFEHPPFQPAPILRRWDFPRPTGLISLELLSDEFDRDELNAMLEIVSGSETSLRRFCGTDNVVWALPIRTYAMLAHLEIVRCDEVENLSLIFRHAPQLQSLDLSDAHFGIFRQLDAYPNALPKLKSFRLVVYAMFPFEDSIIDDIHPAVAMQAMQTVIRFLHNKRGSLQRLNLHIDGTTSMDMHMLFEFLPSLTSLEVVGFAIYTEHMTEESFALCARSLPINLRMFSISLAWELDDLYVQEINPLYNVLSELPRLQLLRFKMAGLRFTPEDMASHFPHLHTLALGMSSMWDIDRRAIRTDSEEMLEVTLERWSYRRAKHCRAEDFRFDGEDAEWLLRSLIGELTGPD